MDQIIAVKIPWKREREREQKIPPPKKGEKKENLDQHINPWEIQSNGEDAQILLHHTCRFLAQAYSWFGIPPMVCFLLVGEKISSNKNISNIYPEVSQNPPLTK